MSPRETGGSDRPAGRDSSGPLRSVLSTAPARETAALFDETSFSKLEVLGPGAADFLEQMCANRVARAPGTITYTQLCNPAGGVECDFTVTRLGEERFRIVTGTAFGNHDLAWLRAHVPLDGSVLVEDVTSRYACFALWGPSSRAILQPLSETDLSSEAFPYIRAREILVGPVPCLAMRVTFVGELGWELYCPSEFALRLWDTLVAGGKDHGLVPGGYKAIESLRLEKGYRVWGSDVTSADTPFEAGLGFAVRLDKETPFIGREALLSAPSPARSSPVSCSTTRAWSCSGPNRCGWTAVLWESHERWVRLQRRTIDRLRLPARARDRAWPPGGSRHFRALRRGRGRLRTALRPDGFTRALLRSTRRGARAGSGTPRDGSARRCLHQ